MIVDRLERPGKTAFATMQHCLFSSISPQ